jgi:hypothetical protein
LCEPERAPCAGLRQRATDAAIGSAILDRASEVRVQIITANRQLPTTKEDMAVTFDRADSHPGSSVTTDVQVAIPENLHSCSTAAGSVNELNSNRPDLRRSVPAARSPDGSRLFTINAADVYAKFDSRVCTKHGG